MKLRLGKPLASGKENGAAAAREAAEAPRARVEKCMMVGDMKMGQKRSLPVSGRISEEWSIS